MKHNPTLKMEYQEPLPHPTHLKRERERERERESYNLEG